jgi:hypothetical protein
MLTLTVGQHQGPPRRAGHPAARRTGLRRRRPRHPRPRHRRPGRRRAPVHHLYRDRVSDRVREGVQRRGPVLPLAASGGTPQGRARLEAAGPPRRAARPAQPPLRWRVDDANRARRGFHRVRQNLPVPASAPKPGRPGPGRPPGARNHRPASRHDASKTVKRTGTKPKKQQAGDRLNNKLSAVWPGSRPDAREPGPRGHGRRIRSAARSAIA